MKPGFSEFSYGFALTREICERWRGGIRAAPVFPSLIQEGKAGGGYDMFLEPGFPLFLQFKISHYMSRASAGEWSYFRSAYYRFWLHAPRHSDQHRLLLKRDRRPNVVLYAAPAIHKLEDLNRAYLTETVINRSVFVRPSAIGTLPTREEHCVVFQPGSGYGWRCSEPVRIEITAFGTTLRESLEGLYNATAPTAPTSEFFDHLADGLLSDASEILKLDQPGDFHVNQMQSSRERAAFLSRTILGAELLWISRSPVPPAELP